MLKRSLLLIFTITSLFTFYELKLNAAENNSSEPVSVIDRNNQMMMAFTERLKSGNINEARKIAQDITSFSKKYQDNAAIEYKSFYSKIEKELYILKNKDSKKKVVWVEEPISDGYYFLAVIDCHQKQYKDAINNIQKCIMWNPVRAPYYLERGFIFLNSGVDSNLLSAQVAYEQALELANNEEDFASALRGLGFVFAARNLYEESAAAMILSKKYDSNRIEADEHLLSLKKSIPYFDFNMNEQKAKQILKSRKIQTTYSPEHAKILVKLASEFKIPEQKEKAIAYLTGALILDPQNQEIINKIKVLNK